MQNKILQLPKIRLKNNVKVILSLLAFLILFSFIERRHQNKACEKINIEIKNQNENFFLNEEDITRLMTNDGKDELLGKSYQDISVKQLEDRIKANIYVRHCQVSRNVKGNLFVVLELKKPIARFIRKDKPDFYIDSLGTIMPVVERYSARVLAISREPENTLPDFQENVVDRVLLKLLNTIHQDEFFKAQIATISMNKYNQLTIYPQVGKQVIEFGSLNKYKEKLKKLKIFYTKILPLKSWNAYKKVSLKYDNQIICE